MFKPKSSKSKKPFGKKLAKAKSGAQMQASALEKMRGY